ncbi:MAG: hypothetical protein RIQ59_1841 [Bacteroidota bacterium]|jgi:DNA-binding NarL/FixJ family response regulator
MEQIKVAVAEKHDILRAYVVDLLKGVDHFEIVFDSFGATDLMDKISRLEVNVLVLSTSLLGYDGEDALKIIRESDQVPNLKIIMYSNRTDNLSIEDMAKQGANSFLNKTAEADEIIESIETVFKDGYYFNKYFTKEILDSVFTETI